jgi:hypothetical protein
MPESQIVVWMDRDALELETRVGRETELRTQPEAAAAIRHLIDADCRVVVWGLAGPVDDANGLGLPDVETSAVLPEDASGWLVTADEARCDEARTRRGLRTILVGPAVPGRGLAHRASDLEARDLVDAVLVILTADAMPDAKQAVGS